MEISLTNHIKTLIPNFIVSVIRYQGITVSTSPQMIQGRLRLFQESIFFELQDQSVTSVPEIAEWRQLFKQSGTDPSKYRPSIESLYRRIQKQTYLPTVNSAVDINNFFSLKYKIPIGIYDLNNLKGDVVIDIGGESDSYIGLNNRDLTLSNKIISRDEIGAFGSPYVDSNRSPVDHTTTDAIQILYLPPSIDRGEANKLTASLENMFLQIHGGEATHKIVD
ncbi:B3/B4 domain-containing protein [Priestia koreensis]|uniref:B3/B4 domain-containing protein n=1 Tax=Priestia koreensis TaxID=284581 RepID=UPI00203F548C|nr:phenylalanine--tRNA ligase beta subunit-related protein [Priestia koreensis]